MEVTLWDLCTGCLWVCVLTLMAEAGCVPTSTSPCPWRRLVVLPNEGQAWLGASVLPGAPGQS